MLRISHSSLVTPGNLKKVELLLFSVIFRTTSSVVTERFGEASSTTGLTVGRVSSLTGFFITNVC